MNPTELKNLIGYKEDRLKILNEKKQILIDLDNEISVSKFMRSFRTFYYNSKRFVLLLLLGICLMAGVLALINPNILFLNSNRYKTELIINFKDSYKEISKETFGETLKKINNSSFFDNQSFESNIEKSVEKVAVQDIHFTIRFFAILLLCFGLVLWYVAQLTKKLKFRNELISKADSVAQEIINDYKAIIEEEEREIVELKNKMNNTTTPTS